MEAERWVIVGKSGLQLYQCLFEGPDVKMSTLPAMKLVTHAFEKPKDPMTFPTKHQAERLIEVLKWYSGNDIFGDAKAVRL